MMYNLNSSYHYEFESESFIMYLVKINEYRTTDVYVAYVFDI